MVFIGRSGDKGEARRKELRGKGPEVSFSQGSVAVEADVKKAISLAVEKYGTLTTVVNNAAATDVSTVKRHHRGLHPHRRRDHHEDGQHRGLY